jgi:hypothetical protein
LYFANNLMACFILVGTSRQVWAFARDEGLPFVYSFVKYINPKFPVPYRATGFAGIICLLLELLILLGPVGSNALFSIAVLSTTLAWSMPVFLVLLPVGRSRFVPGPFYWGKTLSTIVNSGTCLWALYVIIMSSFPNDKGRSGTTMNYFTVGKIGVWIFTLIYYYIHGYKVYNGPKSNLTEESIGALVLRDEYNVEDSKNDMESG